MEKGGVMDELSKIPGTAVMHTALGGTESIDHLSIHDRDDLGRAVTILKQYGAVGVYLFGSMATGDGKWEVGFAADSGCATTGS